MKLLGVVGRDAGEPRAYVEVDYTGRVPVAGDPPRPALLELDCPGLREPSRASLLAWLANGAGQRVGQGRATGSAAAGALDAVPASCWRVAAFREVVDLPNFDVLTHQACYAAPLGEISACLGERVPALLARLDAALALDDAEQVTALRRLQSELQKTSTIGWSLNHRTQVHIEDVALRVDGAALADLKARVGTDLRAWVAAAANMKSDEGRALALAALVATIPADADARARAQAIVEAVRANRRLREATAHAPSFWPALGPLLDFPATEREGEVSLADASEVVVAAGWELWEGRRVGRIKPGRKALVVAREAAPWTFVRGGGALLQKVIDAGGRLRHHGVTLSYPTTSRPLTPLLGDVARIDTLAHVDPAAAVALLGDRAPAADHPLHALAARARFEPQAGRALADMLIEFAAGIDADVARKLARARRR